MWQELFADLIWGGGNFIGSLAEVVDGPDAPVDMYSEEPKIGIVADPLGEALGAIIQNDGSSPLVSEVTAINCADADALPCPDEVTVCIETGAAPATSANRQAWTKEEDKLILRSVVSFAPLKPKPRREGLAEVDCVHPFASPVD